VFKQGAPRYYRYINYRSFFFEKSKRVVTVWGTGPSRLRIKQHGAVSMVFEGQGTRDLNSITKLMDNGCDCPIKRKNK